MNIAIVSTESVGTDVEDNRLTWKSVDRKIVKFYTVNIPSKLL